MKRVLCTICLVLILSGCQQTLPIQTDVDDVWYAEQPETNPGSDVYSDHLERFTQVIYQLGKAIEREHYLSTPILTASDTNACFDCHDKIERMRY